MPQRTVGILLAGATMKKSTWASNCTQIVIWACRKVLTSASNWQHDLFCNWIFEWVINYYFFSRSQRVKCTSSLLSIWHKARDRRPRWPARFSSRSWNKVDWFYVYISEWLFNLPQGVFFCRAIQYYFNSAADICHAVPQSATFPATSVSPAGKTLLCPSLGASPWAAASASSPLPATTPWMVSCFLSSPLAFSHLSGFVLRVEMEALWLLDERAGVACRWQGRCKGCLIPWVQSSMASWDGWPLLTQSLSYLHLFVRVCVCVNLQPAPPIATLSSLCRPPSWIPHCRPPCSRPLVTSPANPWGWLQSTPCSRSQWMSVGRTES